MADYVPACRKAPLLTIEHFDVRLDELRPMLAYATQHDDVLAEQLRDDAQSDAARSVRSLRIAGQ